MKIFSCLIYDYYNLFNQFFQEKNVIKVIKIISLISWENRPTTSPKWGLHAEKTLILSHSLN